VEDADDTTYYASTTDMMSAVGPRFEVIVFTASLGKYADPLLDLLDQHKVIKWRLFREACYPWEGSYVKDLECMGRDMRSMILVDNSPHSYAFQPENAVPIGTFIDDPSDQELLECLDTLLAVEFAPEMNYRHRGLSQKFWYPVFLRFHPHESLVHVESIWR